MRSGDLKIQRQILEIKLCRTATCPSLDLSQSYPQDVFRVSGRSVS